MLMCNKKCGCLGETHLQSDNTVDHRECYQARLEMDDSPSAALASGFKSNRSSNDYKHPRVKLLCSFAGGIMPRPQDGKLRYVGGETRIVSLPRDINYEELMVRMRELYEGATLLKYQQPDEDLDALVSVVNDDDVTNMMEEYDKLGSGDGFIRLRVFLFSHPEQESSPLIFDVDEMDSERRYVDALNSLNDASDLRMQLQTDSSVMNSVEEAQIAEQFYNQVSLEGSIHNQRNFDTPIPQFNLRHLRIPHIGSGQHQQPIVTHRHNDMEASWSPAYCSPRHYGHRYSRPLTEFPPSPSSARLHVPLGDLPDKMQEEYSWQQVTQHSQCNHLPQFLGNSAWFPSGAICGDRGGFPGNILHGSNVFEANNSSEHARMTFRRSQANPDSPYNLGEQSQFEQSNLGNGVPQMGNQFAECSPSMGTHFLNKDPGLYHGMYPKEQNDHRSLYDEPQSHETRWIRQHHLNPQAEEVRAHGAGRVTMNFANGHGNVLEGHHVPPNCVYHEDPRYIQTGHDMVKEAFHDQVVAAGSHIPFPLDENGFQYGNLPHAYGTDSPYQVSPAHVPGHDLCRNVQNIHNPMHGAPYEASNLVQDANGIVNPRFLKGTVEGSPRPSTGAVNQNTWVDSPPKVLGLDGFPVPDYSSGHALNLNSSGSNQESQQQFRQDQVQLQPGLINFVSSTEPIPYSTPSSPSTLRSDKLITPSIPDYNLKHKDDADDTEAIKREQRSTIGEEKLMKNVQTFEGIKVPNISSPRSDQKADKISEAASLESVNSDCLRPLDKFGDVVNPGGSDLFAPNEDSELSDNHFSFLPKLLDSVKKAAVQGVEEVKARVEKKEGADPLQVSANKEAALEDSETANANEESKLDSENANQSASATIEPTKAEEEAIARGLQTIKSDDLEEIREIGTGTYGAVYHGKWKGSDVAIKRIKASCFAGRPSERERLITDFWKEALILSSLHHPNVVSFYGIVRDGPDGSLATVTEFMVNGSLKQFLKKKDRTIDRRKRLIIAMDTAFGLEYLHGKNIVHFDLKCENLLVNMRDPHRPVCKIGDLGLSKVKQHTLVTGGVRGTLPWMAPELLTGKSNKVTEKIDVYSFGIVLWELLTGEEPYGDMHCASVIGGIVSNTLRPQIPTWCDPEWKSLMEGCWASDPTERPSFSEISQKLRTMAAAINVK